MGPSPLTRGSHHRHYVSRQHRGSIPAHAGQPMGQAEVEAFLKVHPRSRGAAAKWSIDIAGLQGPSPLTRGSPDQAQDALLRSGSIPAHAGQPLTLTQCWSKPWVHPRSRGAAPAPQRRQASHLGPSPLTRGSRRVDRRRDSREGSIPAHAGQPLACRRISPALRVHPRSRGAASSIGCTSALAMGPSPLTRGSPLPKMPETWPVGSIPAHAGQPIFAAPLEHRQWVHPRSRGAAPCRTLGGAKQPGPSPLTRGSPTQPRQGVPSKGSIPAHAGQPCRTRSSWCAPRVHPRSRGAAAAM